MMQFCVTCAKGQVLCFTVCTQTKNSNSLPFTGRSNLQSNWISVANIVFCEKQITVVLFSLTKQRLRQFYVCKQQCHCQTSSSHNSPAVAAPQQHQAATTELCKLQQQRWEAEPNRDVYPVQATVWLPSVPEIKAKIRSTWSCSSMADVQEVLAAADPTA